MLFNEKNTSLWPCIRSMHINTLFSWNPACVTCRVGGAIILFISTICLILNIRYLIWHKQKQYRNTLVLSLFLASLLVLTISVPGALLQLFTCHRICSQIYCRMEGFISYLAGCLCMLIYMNLSVNRYLILRQYHQPLLHRYSTIICWFLSIGWTLPPVFDCWISYIPEGLGFHCSINWEDPSKLSHFYILISFVGIYFVPLIILFSVNLRVHQIIRNMYSSQSFYYIYQPTTSSSITRRGQDFIQILNNQSSNAICYMQKAADRKHLRIEYRSIRAIIFLVSTYLCAWAPYSIVALLQLFHIEFVFQHAFLITSSAFIAKLSVILAPFLYLSIMHFRLFKKLLFQK